ncbi:VOC family protein [Novilysobacter antarcticus]|uniref:VOC family protein n=1 Tax=Novilysobacter antarcticus TaxID=2862543 RepID=UPI001C99F73D|nr:VOC family protein [Lysobacter antarcticus]
MSVVDPSTLKFRGNGILHVTLIAPDLDAACAAYREQLGLTVAARESLGAELAAVLGAADLAGAPVAWLANPAGECILRLVEDPHARPLEPMFRHGWLSLEVLVADVDALVADLHPPFRVLRPPADLELSPAIRASQVLGPCGEMLYLTSIKEAVPPFDLPMSDERVSHTFIGVMATPDRDASQAAWAALADHPGWAFETKITVLNDAFGKDLASRYPVAAVPLPGQSLVEIDEVPLPQTDAASVLTAGERYAGQHSIALRLPALPDGLAAAGWTQIADVHTATERHVGLIGPAGEHVQLVVAGDRIPS